MRTGFCGACGREIVRIRPTGSRRTVALESEPVWIRKETGGDIFIRADGLVVFGEKAGDALDDPEEEIEEAYERHECRAGGRRRNRKPRAPGYK